MAWLTSTADLRTLLSDATNDRLGYRKKVFGTCDGTNKTFKTFEFRRVTNFTDAVSSAAPLGVYINGVRVDPANILSDDPITGEFTLKNGFQPTGPAQVIQASYYTEQFLDAELSSILTRATQSLGLGLNVTQVDPALWDAVINYAASECLKKLALRWTQRASDVFLLEDVPKKEALGISETYTKFANQYYKDAVKMRDDFYTRQGMSLAPNFIGNFGNVSSVTPRR